MTGHASPDCPHVFRLQPHASRPPYPSPGTAGCAAGKTGGDCSGSCPPSAPADSFSTPSVVPSGTGPVESVDGTSCVYGCPKGSGLIPSGSSCQTCGGNEVRRTGVDVAGQRVRVTLNGVACSFTSALPCLTAVLAWRLRHLRRLHFVRPLHPVSLGHESSE